MERVHYMDVTSMFPFIMLDPCYFNPVKEPTILMKGHDIHMLIDKVFGVIKLLIIAPDNLYFPYFLSALVIITKCLTI